MAADGGIVDAHVIVRQAADRIPLFGHVVFSQYLIVQTKN